MTRKAQLRHTALFAALALGAAGLPALAGAQESARIEIRHADLDLSTAAGRDELDRRIDSAAQRLCCNDAATGTRVVDRAAIRECVASVRRQVQGRLAMADTSARR